MESQIEELENRIMTTQLVKKLTPLDKLLIKNWKRSIDILKNKKENVQNNIRKLHPQG